MKWETSPFSDLCQHSTWYVIISANNFMTMFSVIVFIFASVDDATNFIALLPLGRLSVSNLECYCWGSTSLWSDFWSDFGTITEN